MSCTKIGDLCKTPSERTPLRIPLRGSEFIRTWEAQNVYAAGERVRPRKANGYEYECTAPGQVLLREPSWPIILGDAVSDGSVTWTCRAISNASLTREIQSVTWIGGGLTIDGTAFVSASGENELSAYISGGTAGQTYEVIARITFSDGSIEDALVEVDVH
jgi:hypothetical protein